ncbi:MFS general substrate transporter [Irpex rosettiformis]|uniref:MFS general substrate transporter n=1 Tax=Irpex rosettiformis TaxID=378272 RepID=A0ACB8U2E4_9APHY|nr:MFS general substrate transporter [Irpex rosettiformis]
MAHPSPSSSDYSPDQTTPTPPTANPTHRHHHSNLEEYEELTGRPPFVLTYTEIKLLGIAGVGFFLDAYDLFIINPVATMLQYRLYNGHSLPTGLEGFMKAGANIGSVIGQFGFGFAADYFGRKAVYGKELMLIIFATIMCISDPTGDISPSSALIWLAVWRIILGIGVGGDYPMSASVTTERARIRRRGALLAYIFSNQGWGSLVGSLVFMIVLLCYKHTMDVEGHTSKVDGVWRICVGLSLVPAFGTLYQRLRLPESTRFEEMRKVGRHVEDGDVGGDEIAELKDKKQVNESATEKEVSQESSGIEVEGALTQAVPHGVSKKEAIDAKSDHFKEFFHYFSEWRHLRILLGTSISWFLLDIAFYGINLNQNVVLQQIKFDGSSGTPWHRLFRISIGNLIITALGFVPGYYATILTIEKLGRKWIQTQGFLMAALFLGVLAGKFHTLSTASFVVCFAFLQFFFNFGANSTTFIVPAEVFPTKFRAAAHGMSAAAGKAGAIISALAFNQLSKKLGTPAVLWIFFGCCIGGAVFTQLLPESKGYDPDAVYAEELAEAKRRGR